MPAHRLGKLWKSRAYEVDKWILAGEYGTEGQGNEEINSRFSGCQTSLSHSQMGVGKVSTDEVMRVLLRECPNGVSFAPMALRLLRQKVPLKDSQIERLRSQMFQLENGLWFSSEMISDDEPLSLLRGRASEWLGEHGCFSVERLSEGFRGNLRHVATPEQFAAFLQHLGFTVAGWRRSGFFCHRPPLSLEERLAEGSRTIAGLLEEAGGTLALSMIHEAMPHLTDDALEGVREQFLPDVHRTEVGGHPCWRSAEAIPLPEDFAEKLTAAVDSLVALGEKVSAAKVEFALNLSYGMRFREVYGLPDNGAFMRLCAKHYQGANDVFPRATKARGTPGVVSSPAERTRSANTRFLNLGIPIGAELVFTRDSQVTCTVAERGKPGRKPQLTEAILRVLSDAASPLRVADIADELERRDFKTRSKNLRNLVREALSRTPGITRVNRGSYTVGK